ncbi:MAG: hypothetical protein M3345_05600 [Actinomycetota bacterium]|nr:hypothetical protein [Actinomycetota bacterium]
MHRGRFLLWVLTALLLAACDNVNFVERVEIVNGTSYTARVDVSGEDGGWLALATVSAGSSREVREVIDQGPTWTFRFVYAGYDPVELTIARPDLVDAGWRVEVPDELEERLRDAGVAPPP